MKFFKLGGYDQAITVWEQERKQKPDAKLTAVLAEAYFRRGVKRQERADVTTAVSLQQDNPLYQYHLGLAQQRDGDLDKAIAVYQRVSKVDEQWAKRVSYVLALAYQRQGIDPARKEIWSQLSPAEQVQFEQVRRVQGKNRDVAVAESVVWQGISAYVNGRYAESKTLLEEAIADTQETTLAHYYLGNLAAQEENWKTAVSHWEKARANGFDSPTFIINLGEAYHRLAEDSIAQEAYESAVGYAQSAVALKGEQDNALNRLRVHAYEQTGYQLANAGEWHKAREQWELADEQGKGNFRLSCNLALAYEQTDDYDA
ncbi:MAG: tetratricopeptide repeat protein, partial [Gallionellaceae bacterium]